MTSENDTPTEEGNDDLDTEALIERANEIDAEYGRTDTYIPFRAAYRHGSTYDTDLGTVGRNKRYVAGLIALVRGDTDVSAIHELVGSHTTKELEAELENTMTAAGFPDETDLGDTGIGPVIALTLALFETRFGIDLEATGHAHKSDIAAEWDARYVEDLEVFEP